MSFSTLTTLCCALAISISAASAQTIKIKLQPGLWEESNTTLINGQNLQEMMRKQSGAPAAGKNETCLTPAQVNKGIDLADIKNKIAENAKGCSVHAISADESGGQFELQCSSPEGLSYQGHGQYRVKNDKEWSFTMQADGKLPGASNKLNVRVEQVAHWKSSQCGKVAAQQ
ncbi:DUF3617 family protein [Undibacterium sp. CCC2.1]|nr:DUF3617 family protein [Undibacterium sp. CCC2.1]MEB0170583.1 DUF3617 family protein [Undibacterium sp. CCC1.1]MEB0174524.1 DUF3617 family protein [Undibacterium sp. CCC3.4]